MLLRCYFRYVFCSVFFVLLFFLLFFLFSQCRLTWAPVISHGGSQKTHCMHVETTGVEFWEYFAATFADIFHFFFCLPIFFFCFCEYLRFIFQSFLYIYIFYLFSSDKNSIPDGVTRNSGWQSDDVKTRQVDFERVILQSPTWASHGSHVGKFPPLFYCFGRLSKLQIPCLGLRLFVCRNKEMCKTLIFRVEHVFVCCVFVFFAVFFFFFRCCTLYSVPNAHAHSRPHRSGYPAWIHTPTALSTVTLPAMVTLSYPGVIHVPLNFDGGGGWGWHFGRR